MPRKKADVIEIISRFQKNILDNKPTKDEMYEDIRMMKFKIKPIQGDISLLNLRNNQFIETLWSLGKIDEFFHNHIEKLPKNQREIFFKLLDDMYDKFQDDLNTIDMKQDHIAQMHGVEMEIFKERIKKSN